jgi:glycogen operon protein
MTDTQPGQPYPLGATIHRDGVNFSVFAKNCERVELLLFDHHDDAAPSRVIALDSRRNKTFYYWHVFVPSLKAGQLYGYRVHGSFAPERWLRYDGSKVLVDPYARAVMYGDNYSRAAAQVRGQDNCAQALKSVVVDIRDYNWEGDTPIQRPYSETVIYELHVGGFTRHESSGVEAGRRGTYLGLIDKIPYLKSLGITTVELLPIQQFDEQDTPTDLKNYWGYSPVAFFAPHRGYTRQASHPLAPVTEFCDLVKAMHRAGIEVILDVAFNHTAESDEAGPTLSMRGFEDQAYYILNADGNYMNFTGCGNTINGYHSIVRRLIMECLHYWVQVMHVDGFRFDLASVLARDEQGQPISSPPLLWEIESDPILAGTKIIAEAWDAAGLYQVGSFIGDRWTEWNGKYRDDVRQFVKGDSGLARTLASRLMGSPDIFTALDRDPNRSINFVACHDGFTLNDLVSYNEKHNQSNLQNNADGNSHNLSWNCGVEGPTTDVEIEALRRRQIKNFIATLFTSHGTPMLLMGDEVRRTQQGNNNAYCQDNALSWFDWNDLDRHADLLRFVREMIRFHQGLAVFSTHQFWAEADHPTGDPRPIICWHGPVLNQPDWGYHSHTLAYELTYPDAGEHLYVAYNAYWETLKFELPALPEGQHWRRVVDTALTSPSDIAEAGKGPIERRKRYPVAARSVVVFQVK